MYGSFYIEIGASIALEGEHALDAGVEVKVILSLYRELLIVEMP